MSVRWGLSATIKAPTSDILRFAAYHLDLGAHRLYLYLDDANETAFKVLKTHSKVRAQICDAGHWKRLMGRRPERHQVRQSLNATHAYSRRTEVDWLIHMDVDEYLIPERPLSETLSALPHETSAARARPMELLGGSQSHFKAFIPAGPERQRIVQDLYPTFGAHLKGGFVSHVAGKVFLRTGQPDITVQIHDALVGPARLPAAELDTIGLAHFHAASWDAWHAAFAYRLAKGSYRAELKPLKGALSIYELLRTIEAQEGTDGLRRFYDEVIGDSPDLRTRLAAHGVLRRYELDFDTPLRRHFPSVAI